MEELETKVFMGGQQLSTQFWAISRDGHLPAPGTSEDPGLEHPAYDHPSTYHTAINE